MTPKGGMQIVREGQWHIKLLTAYAPIRLRTSKVREFGLLAYLVHVEAMQTKNATGRAKEQLSKKYANAMRVLMRIQAGDCKTSTK